MSYAGPPLPAPAGPSAPPVVAEPGTPTRRALLLAAGLFLLTLLSTLTVGAQFALSYAQNHADLPLFFDTYRTIWHEPVLLWLGMPFAFTLLGILLAHELGHFFACRYYGIAASYPYFLPAPTLIGTFGAFIRIRSPMVNRTALFDVGLAGPVVGFLFAAPALALAIAHSKVVPGAAETAPVVFGAPLLEVLLATLLRPGVDVGDLLLHPVGRAAWVGLFATALNLLPVGQLDGGHIVYALCRHHHRRISLACLLALLLLGIGFWPGWLAWAVLLLLLGYRHPALLDGGAPLDRRRHLWAVIALVIFLLCFVPVPFAVRLL
ncbi:MAG: site-2 protease family protein [Firmicutes bacterium]|nr:site-2 protease family protein [Bacillota bacterium]